MRCAFYECATGCVWRLARDMRGLRRGAHLLLRGGGSGGDVPSAPAAAAGGAAVASLNKPLVITCGGVGRLIVCVSPSTSLSISTSTFFSERWWSRAAAVAALRSASTSASSSSGSAAAAATTTTTTTSGEGTEVTADSSGAGVPLPADVEPPPPLSITPEDVAVASQRECADVLRIFKVVRAIRNRGHFAARLDPLGRSLG